MPEIRSNFKGATTECCPDILQLQVLRNILMGDYESLYPNAIIACNLGIDSLIDENVYKHLKGADLVQFEKNHFKINLNFADRYLVEAALNKILTGTKITKEEEDLINLDNNPEYAYFSKK